MCLYVNPVLFMLIDMSFSGLQSKAFSKSAKSQVWELSHNVLVFQLFSAISADFNILALELSDLWLTKNLAIHSYILDQQHFLMVSDIYSQLIKMKTHGQWHHINNILMYLCLNLLCKYLSCGIHMMTSNICCHSTHVDVHIHCRFYYAIFNDFTIAKHRKVQF